MPDTVATAPSFKGFAHTSPAQLIKARRVALPSHELSGVPDRRWALAVCQAETDHAKREFWRLAHDLGLECCFDRYLEPACHEAAALPHERKAGRVLVWLTHLQVEEQEIAKSIGMGMLRTARGYMRALFRQRHKLRQGFRQVLGEYRALRAEIDAVERRVA